MNTKEFIVAIIALVVLAVAALLCIYKEDFIIAFAFGLLAFGIVEYFIDNRENYDG